MPLSASVEDYLKTIYQVELDHKPVSTSEIAERMGVTPASVTGMLQRLSASKPRLAHYTKHQGATLTAYGQRSALEIIRHHRLLETYLVSALGYSWDGVHEEACRLEHVMSEELERRISTALGDPQRDPHGELIPTAALVMPPDVSRPLSTLRPPEQATVVQVRTSEPELLRHLAATGLIPGAMVEARDYSAFDQTLEVEVDGQHVLTVGDGISRLVFVESR